MKLGNLPGRYEQNWRDLFLQLLSNINKNLIPLLTRVVINCWHFVLLSYFPVIFLVSKLKTILSTLVSCKCLLLCNNSCRSGAKKEFKFSCEVCSILARHWQQPNYLFQFLSMVQKENQNWLIFFATFWFNIMKYLMTLNLMLLLLSSLQRWS